MGYNTTLLVLNDRLGDIKRDPERFVEELVLAAGSGRHHGPHQHDFHAGSQSGIICTHHADNTSIILVGGNYATVLGVKRGYRHHEPRNQVDALEHALSQLGYSIRRKTKRELEPVIRAARHELATLQQLDPSRGGTREVDWRRQRSWEASVKSVTGRLDFLEEMLRMKGDKET